MSPFPCVALFLLAHVPLPTACVAACSTAATMVFEDERSDDTSSLPYMHSTGSSDELKQVSSLELGTITNVGDNCGFVEWVDQQWSPTMRNASLKLWTMVEDSKSARLTHNLESALTIHHSKAEKNTLEQCRSELVADMKGEMSKKDVDQQKLNEKYQLLVKLIRAQASVIHNLKLKHMKEKELLSEARMKFESQNAQLTKFEEKLTQEKLELKLQVADLLKGKENHVEEKGQLKLQIVDLMEGEEKLKRKIKGIQAILEK
ncbi:hypothetical protein D1007_60203 [Hordeum vulgare]|nr:hypothetical protein D1007_60203 [Hordeum vulgare]